MSARRGIPVVVSAPSGGGKTTLCHRVIASLSDVAFSVSHTTRQRRAKESDGVDYHFVDDAAFARMVDDSAFLEWAWVHKHRYGSSRAPVETLMQQGVDVLFDIDVQGGKQVAARLSGVLLVFVVPPSMDVLEQRLRGRSSDSEEQIRGRLQAARQEIEAARDSYPIWIVNDVLDHAVDELRSLLVTERLRRVDVRQVADRFLQAGG